VSILSCRGALRVCGVSSGDVMPDSWREQASCLDVDAELFFPVGDGPAAREQAEEARAVCRGCSVLGQCRELELTTVSGRLRNEFGVFAGMSADERRVELHRRARQARRARAGRGVAA
jgi:WhiB family redox-sensing transcriptional regulator